MPRWFLRRKSRRYMLFNIVVVAVALTARMMMTYTMRKPSVSLITTAPAVAAYAWTTTTTTTIGTRTRTSSSSTSISIKSQRPYHTYDRNTVPSAGGSGRERRRRLSVSMSHTQSLSQTQLDPRRRRQRRQSSHHHNRHHQQYRLGQQQSYNPIFGFGIAERTIVKYRYGESSRMPLFFSASASWSSSSTTGASSSVAVDDNNDDSTDPKDIDTTEKAKEDTIFALSSGFGGQQADQATAVAVVRISGPHAHDVLEELLTKTPSTNEDETDDANYKTKAKMPKPRQAAVRNLYYDNVLLDQALVLLFKGPNSFTGEDLVELHCHGSRPIIKRLLEEALPSINNTSRSTTSPSSSASEAGNDGEEDEGYRRNFICRMADPGEFTQRAYQNGKLDLVQVEALADVLSADTSTQVTQALRQLDGQTSKRYEQWRSLLISGLAHAEAVIDFGDDEHLGMDDDVYDEGGVGGGGGHVDDMYSDENLQRRQMEVWGDVGVRMNALSDAMHSHLEDGRRGEIIREGVKIAIVGPPNAGKSSLFNLLARKEAAIVSPIAGTTRDVLQLSLDLGGVKCTLYDTAGVRGEDETADVLEIEGMKRAMAVVKEADLVVAMTDATTTTTTKTATNTTSMTTPTTVEYEKFSFQGLIEAVFNDNERSPGDVMLVLNKMDLLLEDDADRHNNTCNNSLAVRAFTIATGGVNGGGIYEISCETQAGVDRFLNALRDKAVQLTQGLDEEDDHNTSAAPVESAMITRARHRRHVEAAAAALDRFVVLSSQGSMAVDMAAEELRLAASELGRITGAVDVEQVLDELFSTFCIGK